MNDSYKNRLAMCRTVLKVLDAPVRRSFWLNQKPVAFTRQVNALRIPVATISKIAQQQEIDITGHAEDKEREKLDVSTMASPISSALSAYFEEKNDKTNATAAYLSASDWEYLRDDTLLNRSRALHEQLTKALADDAAGLADYGIDAADATDLLKEIDEFAEHVSTPAAAISVRRAQTAALRPHFQEISTILRLMDRTVLRFATDAAGRDFVATYQAARIIRDTGSGPTEPPATPPAA